MPLLRVYERCADYQVLLVFFVKRIGEMRHLDLGSLMPLYEIGTKCAKPMRRCSGILHQAGEHYGTHVV